MCQAAKAIALWAQIFGLKIRAALSLAARRAPRLVGGVVATHTRQPPPRIASRVCLCAWCANPRIARGGSLETSNQTQEVGFTSMPWQPFIIFGVLSMTGGITNRSQFHLCPMTSSQKSKSVCQALRNHNWHVTTKCCEVLTRRAAARDPSGDLAGAHGL